MDLTAQRRDVDGPLSLVGRVRARKAKVLDPLPPSPSSPAARSLEASQLCGPRWAKPGWVSQVLPLTLLSSPSPCVNSLEPVGASPSMCSQPQGSASFQPSEP